jgi:hypothetical protein
MVDTTRKVVVFTIATKEHDFLIDSTDNVKYPILLDTKSKEKYTKAEDNPLACAKQVRSEHRTKYFVKRNTRGHFMNPIGPETFHTTKTIPGRPEWKFVEVSEKAFNYYIRFLATKNRAWLLNAERSII